jgi:3-aminobutyryl-CoA ammonia-lyase
VSDGEQLEGAVSRGAVSAGAVSGGAVSAGAETDPRLGLTVTHRRYVPYSHAHYGGNLVDGAYVLGLFGDVATEASIRTDGDEGLFASYSDVQFRAPVLAGDVLEITATITRLGSRSRGVSFEARVVCRAEPERGPSAARVLADPVIVVTATGTVVAPPA